jgi:hypothetical protein
MKQYTKHYPDTRTDVNNHRPLLTSQPIPTAKRATAGGLSLGGLLKTHVRNTEDETNFLDISFKEWEQWLNDRELRLSQLAYNYRSTFHPTDWSKSPSLIAPQNKEATTTL